jgi:MtN3 and saliva related transmembrane protein
MHWSLTTVLGFAAAALTTMANVPQVWKAWRSRQTEDLSLGMTLILTAGLGLWVVYGLLQADLVIVFANAVATCLALALAALKLRYG